MKTIYGSTTRKVAPAGPLSPAACSPAAIRARISLIVSERGLSARAVDRAMRAASRLARNDDALDDLIDFCDVHYLSLDWLLCGDLRGLKRMRR